MTKKIDSHVIVDLNFSSGDEVQRLLHKLKDTEYTHTWVKVGLRLFLNEGSNFVRYMLSKGAAGYKVMLDLKLNDAPRTVFAAVEAAAGMGAAMVTVHASGGGRMLKQAAEAGQKFGIQTLAVTMLACLCDTDAQEQGFLLAKLACDSGIDGIVCSPEDADLLRNPKAWWQLPNNKLIVTPGILSADDLSDQVRSGTVTQARRAGANYVVVGRPIRDANNPAAVFDAFSREMHQ